MDQRRSRRRYGGFLTHGQVIIHGSSIQKHAGSGKFRWLNRSPGGATIFDIRAGDNKANEWQHYAGTFSRADGKAILYINGRNVGEEKARVGTPIAGDWDNGARVGYNID